MGMDNTQAISFIEKVFSKHWPNWKFEDEEFTFWVKILKKYDYEKATQAINNLYANWEKQGKPPAGIITKTLNSTLNISEKNKTNEPVLLYSILKPNKDIKQCLGMGYAGDPYRADESIEISANNDKYRCERAYGEPCTVIRIWEGDEFRQKYRGEGKKENQEVNNQVEEPESGYKFDNEPDYVY
jgi:hypothetical protein